MADSRTLADATLEAPDEVQLELLPLATSAPQALDLYAAVEGNLVK